VVHVVASINRQADAMPSKPNQITESARYIRGPALRRRWDDMPASTFYWKLNRGLIPEPVYPFGPDTPYWELAEIEALEAAAPTRAQLAERAA
jgi:hypothetical protein